MEFIKNVQEAVRLFENRRVAQDDPQLLASVAKSLAEVRERGDRAVFELVERFDGVRLSNIKVSEADFVAAQAEVSADLARSYANLGR